MNKKYPQGYLPKIQYWQYKVNRYINEGDLTSAEYALKKLSYFTARQVVVENQQPLDQFEHRRAHLIDYSRS
jgi:hypothetical protein